MKHPNFVWVWFINRLISCKNITLQTKRYLQFRHWCRCLLYIKFRDDTSLLSIIVYIDLRHFIKIEDFIKSYLHLYFNKLVFLYNRSVVLDVELLGGNYCMKYLGHKFYVGHFALLVTLERVHKTPLLAQKSAR